MKLDEFKKKVYHHLSEYRKTERMGTWNNKEYPHILFIANDTYNDKFNSIKEFGGLLDDVKKLDFLLDKNELHKEAHHLNSSQIMCYNFFRPLYDDKEKLTKLFNNIRMNNECLNFCKFEYEDNKDDFGQQIGKEAGNQTNFDFYTENESDHIYCEIKYTEGNFGDCKKDDRHKNKYDLYKPMLNFVLKTDVEFDEFCKYYQLFRNAIRATDKVHNHCLFIVPKDRDDLENEFNTWHNKYIKNDLDVRIVYWEDMVEGLKNIGMEKHAVLFENMYLKY